MTVRPLIALVAAVAATACSRPSADKAAAHVMKDTKPAPADRLGTLSPGTGLPVGTPAPEATAQDLTGKNVTLSSLVERGPILLAFYRGGWCPYCNSEIHAYSKAYPDFQKIGVLPILVSVDRPDEGAEMQKTYDIPFPVLSDPGLSFVGAFHVENHVDDATVEKYRSFGVDLEAYSGQRHHTIAVPSLFLIDRSAVIRWAHSEKEYTTRPTPAQVIAAITPLVHP
jgi:peroxiredoxin